MMCRIKQFLGFCLVFLIVALFWGCAAEVKQTVDPVPVGYKYYPQLPAGIQSLDAARQELTRLLKNSIGIKYYGQPGINNYAGKEVLKTLMKGNKSNSISFWYDGNNDLLYIVFDSLSVLEDRIEVSPSIVFFYADLIDNPIIVEKTSEWPAVGHAIVGITDDSFIRQYKVYFPGLLAFLFEDLQGAQRFADNLFFIQQTLQKKHGERLTLFESKAAQYRSSKIKPQVSEEQRKFIVQANAFTQKKDYAGAIDRYNKAIELDPVSYPTAYFNLALLSAQENRFKSAIGYMEQYLMLVPDAPDARSAQDKIYEWEVMIQK